MKTMRPWRAAIVAIVLYSGCTVADHQQHADWPGHVHSWPESALAIAEAFGISYAISLVIFAWVFGALDRKEGS
jgi:hypothetical protein